LIQISYKVVEKSRDTLTKLTQDPLLYRTLSSRYRTSSQDRLR